MKTEIRDTAVLDASTDRKGNVLCVDTEERSRMLIEDVMHPHQVDFALTAEDALDLSQSRIYVVCFINPSVPRVLEIGLVQALRAVNMEVHLVVCPRFDGKSPVLPPGANVWLPAKPLASHSIKELKRRIWNSVHIRSR